MTSNAQEVVAPVKGTGATSSTEATSSPGIIQLSVCDASGVQESIRVDSSISHNAFRTVLKDRFGDCVPMWRPFMASVVRKGKLVRDACFRAGKVGDSNTLHGLGASSPCVFIISLQIHTTCPLPIRSLPNGLFHPVCFRSVISQCSFEHGDPNIEFTFFSLLPVHVHTGIVAGDLLWFSFEAEAQALPPEWIAHPKDLIPLVETDSAARERERTARLKKLEAQLADLKTENRLALKKEDFVRVKELKPLMEVAQKKIDDFLATASSPRRKSPRAASTSFTASAAVSSK